MSQPASPIPPAAPPRAAQDRSREILEIAARIICREGYEKASIQAIADACDLTKGGLYHHIRSKEDLLLAIMHYGMDLFEEQVLSKVVGITDPVARLQECMRHNVRLVTQGSSQEVTIILHEHATLTGAGQAAINARKKEYVRFLESTFTEAIAAGRIRAVHPKVAAFSFLGTVLWLYKWYRADGEISAERLEEEMVDLFFGGLRPEEDRCGAA